MALFKKETDAPNKAGAGGGGVAVKEKAEVEPGPHAAECMKIGQLLVDREQLTPENLALALQHRQRRPRSRSVEFVLQRFRAGRQELATAIAEVWGVVAADTKSVEFDAEIAALVTEQTARSNCVVPIAEENGTIVMLSAAPSPQRRELVERLVEKPVRWMSADPATIRTFIDRSYRADADIDRLVAGVRVDRRPGPHGAIAAEVSLDDQAPVVQLVNRIVSQAMRDRVSDIHVEPLDENLRIRFRIDGHLVEAFNLPIGVHAALSSRLKIMSGMNIVEKRRPQDGQFSTDDRRQGVDVRVGSVATVFGEKIVMRILDKSRSMIGLNQLGFPRETYLHYSKMIHSPFGMVICAGPTGAGKTTTLYASLLEINSSRQERHHRRGPGRVRVPGHQPDPDERPGGPHVRHRSEGHPASGPRRDPRR
jgi:type IV pilus assembly protein PilB